MNGTAPLLSTIHHQISFVRGEGNPDFLTALQNRSCLPWSISVFLALPAVPGLSKTSDASHPQPSCQAPMGLVGVQSPLPKDQTLAAGEKYTCLIRSLSRSVEGLFPQPFHQ